MAPELYDAFISHASEDKDDFVRPLAQRLEAEHIHVWFDEFELRVGDSLNAAIDRGLATSRFGILVLSPSFFAKQWPQRELGGLVARQTAGSARLILPVWHRITRDEVCQHSPPLADTVALESLRGLDYVVRELKRAIRPQGSPLIAARDLLIEFGLTPPVVTDPWWLDVAEASNRETGWGFAPQRPIWGRWTFPLPDEGDSPEQRGERLAWTAMQLRWEAEAERLGICQMTPPEEVLAFVASQPGLEETAGIYPSFLATYAPQLTIPGFGGVFEAIFDEYLKRSIRAAESRRQLSPRFGSALTTTQEPPRCDEAIALHDEWVGHYEPATSACQFVQGDLGGPQCRLYPHFEYLVWLLSKKSEWLPIRIRSHLRQGMAEWGVWYWFDRPSRECEEFGLEGYPHMGTLSRALRKSAESGTPFRMSKSALADLTQRIDFARELLDLPDSTQHLVDEFLAGDFIEKQIEDLKAVRSAQRKQDASKGATRRARARAMRSERATQKSPVE